MKKILVFNKGALNDWYGKAAPEGKPLRARRMEQAGRLELVQITNDPPPYWFVMIRNFDMSDSGRDRTALNGITTPWGNGVWRFTEFARAKAKFDQLATLPIFVGEAQRAKKRRAESAERIRKVSTPFPKKEKPKDT